MEQPLHPGRVIAAGRGALILSMAGSGWLGWGLSSARAFNPVTGPALGIVSILLWICSIDIIRAGRALRRRASASDELTIEFPARAFIVVVLVEALAIALVLVAAVRFHRSDLATLSCALVVGLHYLPLAKIFRAPMLALLGILIAIWCALSWALFKSHALVTAVTSGTGILLWATSIALLLRARKLTHSIESEPREHARSRSA